MPKFFPKRFNGFDFMQRGIAEATFSESWDWSISGITTKNAERMNERPKYSGAMLGGAVKVLSVYLSNPGLSRNDLVIAMDAGSNVQHQFFVEDELGNEWYVWAKATRLAYESHDQQTKMTEFTFILDVDDPVYVAVAEDVDTWSVLADEDTHTVTIGGNQPTNPIIKITPGAPIGYYPFSLYVKNYNPIASLQTDGIDITNGGWDTAALVTAGDMLASGNDVRVIVDGVEAPRWFGGGGINSATTKIYIRLIWNAGAGILLKLRTALSGVTIPDRIEFQASKTVSAILAKFPLSGVIRVGNEEISYTNLNSTLCQADIVDRPVRGTSIAAHSIGDVCYWVEHDIRIIWGNPSADAPVYDESYKPQWDLATGSNSLRNYSSTTGFADVAGLRAGAFKPVAFNDGKGNLCRVYTGVHAAVEVEDPADVMGFELAAYEVQGKVYPDTGEIRWTYEHPALLTSVEVDGQKFKSFSNSIWPYSSALGFELKSSKDGKIFVREWYEDAPVDANTWEDIDHDASEALPTGTRIIMFRFIGSVNGVESNFIRAELDEAIIQLNASNLIQVGFNAAETNFQLGIEIVNTRTGESIFVDYPAAEGVPLTIDTGTFTVTYKGLNAINGLSWSSIRTRWLKLLPGDNPLQFFSSVGSVMQIQFTTHKRAL